MKQAITCKYRVKSNHLYMNTDRTIVVSTRFMQYKHKGNKHNKH